MIRTYCHTVDFILPVRIGGTQLAVSIIVLTFPDFLYKSTKFVTVHYVKCLLYVTERDITVIRDTRFGTCLTFLSSNDNNTVGCARTVNCRSRSIFQYRKTLDVVRIHHRQRVGQTFHTIVIHSQTVNYNQRIIFGRKRRTATYTNRSTTTRSSTIGYDAYTGNLTGHHILCIRSQTLVQLIRFNGCYRTGSIILFHCTVTNDHDLVQQFRIILQRYYHR